MSSAPKCDNCEKGLTKKSPGLECRCCGKVVHANQTCTGLTAKQLAALRNSESLDWTCSECQRESPGRKSSFIIPDIEEEEEEEVLTEKSMGNCNINTNKFLKNITIEMKKLLNQQLQPIESALATSCSKVDSLLKTVEMQNKEIKDLNKKFNNLKNEHAHLQLEIGSLKQHIRFIDQQSLNNVLEVAGIPKLQEENLQEISFKLASVLELDRAEITSVKRIEGRNGQTGTIRIGLLQAQQVEVWIRAARKQPLLVESVINNPPTSEAKSKVFLRRALTKANKSLLWQAQQKLRPSYRYVWFQDGKVLARKHDNAKPVIVRSEDDVESILSSPVDSFNSHR